MKKLNIGLVGYKFMGKAHSHAYKDVSMFFDLEVGPVMKAICGRNEAWVKQVAEKFGWDSYETSWEKLVERDDIDVIDITAPSNVHKEIAIAAAKNGKHVFCEKPLALSLRDAQDMLDCVNNAGVKHMIGFNYRFVPAVRLAKKLIQEGYLGDIYHYRGLYLQDWIIDPNFPLVWRLRKEVAGSGSLGDIGAHSIDLARFLVDEIEEVVAISETFVKERPLPVKEIGLSAVAGREKGQVTVDDATLFICRFRNGALGNFEATRFGLGHRNDNFVEVNGSKGSLRFSAERMNELEFYSAEDPAFAQGFRRILATDPLHDYMGAWWPPGHIIGYEHTFIHEVYELCQAFAHNTIPSPSFIDGVKCQAVLDAVERSAEMKQWVKVV